MNLNLFEMRKSGYYWCKSKEDSSWEIYFFNENFNLFLLNDIEFEEKEFSKIDEKQIVRKEKLR